MKNVCLLLYLTVLVFASCKNDSLEGYEYLTTDRLQDSLYVERYYTSYGVYGGGSQKYFITDSSGYKVYVGESDEKEFVNFSIEGDKVKVVKYTRRNKKGDDISRVGTEYFPLPSK
jgi:hypothetical protein